MLPDWWKSKDNYKIMDCQEGLRELPDEVVHCVVTSPPYWGLRDYGTATWEGGDPECDHNPQKEDTGQRKDREQPLGRGGVFKETCGMCGAKRVDKQMGLEETPQDYIDRMVELFREVRRVLRKDGTLWLNIGDCYIGGGRAGNNGEAYGGMEKDRTDSGARWGKPTGKIKGLKPKDLMMMPARLAIALQEDGWWIRSDIIWHKPNPMPESCKDRPTSSYEHIFLLTKSPTYFYDADAIREPISESTVNRWKTTTPERRNPSPQGMNVGSVKGESFLGVNKNGRNKRNVWYIATHSYNGAHFATYPTDLIIPCILAGSPKGGIVLDPFLGSGTTLEVCRKNDRIGLGFELNPDYKSLIRKRSMADIPSLEEY